VKVILVDVELPPDERREREAIIEAQPEAEAPEDQEGDGED
jgi:anti-sigma factor RsiW